MKKIIIGFLMILGCFVIYLHHLLIFDAKNIDFFGYKGFENFFPNSYKNSFFLKNQDPIYVWKNKTFTEYANYCHSNKLNCIVFPHQQTYADFVWMNSIQYVGSVVDSTKTTFLYGLIDNVTNLNLYWTYPYVFGELLIPINKNMAKNFDMLQKQTSWTNSTLLGEKGKIYNCDQDKLKEILSYSGSDFYKVLNDKDTVWNKLKNPCTIHEIPWYLGFNYYYFLNNGLDSGKNYQIASFNEDTPKIVSSMVAVVAGRMGEHVKSMGLWFSQYISLSEKYAKLTQEDEKDIYAKKIEEASKKTLFEFQLDVTQIAADTYGKNICVKDYDCLMKNGYINKVLTDVAKTCTNFKQKDFEGENLYKVSDKSSDFYDKIKCFTLLYGYKDGYIKDNGEMIYPFNTSENQFEFIWDNDMNDWWVQLKMK